MKMKKKLFYFCNYYIGNSVHYPTNQFGELGSPHLLAEIGFRGIKLLIATARRVSDLVNLGAIQVW